jgi:hypothetical protein
MTFEHDIFISFSPDDNREGKMPEGWVSSFKRFLEMILGQLQGRTPKIVLASQVSPEDYNPIMKACAVIFVMSEPFVHDARAMRDLQHFAAHPDPRALMVNGKSRVFKVSKNFVHQQQQPGWLQNAQSYDLFRYDTLTGQISELEYFFGQDAEKNYWMRLIDLAYDLHKVILANEQKTSVVADQESTKEKVFLADTGYDLRYFRELIRRELHRFGYAVMPDDAMVHQEDTPNWVESLAESQMAIHLIGESFLDNANPETRDLLQGQNLASLDKANANPKFKRLIWLPPELRFTSEENRMGYESLKREADLFDKAEVLQIPIEEFRTTVRNKLKPDQENGKFDSLSGSSLLSPGKSVYLICDPMDREAADKLRQYIKANAMELLEQDYEGDVMDVRRRHQEFLNACHSAIVFCDQASEFWVKSKVLDILKAPGFGRPQPLWARAVYVNRPQANLDLKYYEKNKIQLCLGKTNAPVNGELDAFLNLMNQHA